MKKRILIWIEKLRTFIDRECSVKSIGILAFVCLLLFIIFFSILISSKTGNANPGLKDIFIYLTAGDHFLVVLTIIIFFSLILGSIATLMFFGTLGIFDDSKKLKVVSPEYKITKFFTFVWYCILLTSALAFTTVSSFGFVKLLVKGSVLLNLSTAPHYNGILILAIITAVVFMEVIYWILPQSAKVAIALKAKKTLFWIAFEEKVYSAFLLALLLIPINLILSLFIEFVPWVIKALADKIKYVQYTLYTILAILVIFVIVYVWVKLNELKFRDVKKRRKSKA